MLRHLTRRLPVMLTPKWLDNRIQPVAVRDVLHYLAAAVDLPADINRTFDVGGPDVLTYREMIQRFARITGLRRRLIVTVPVLTPGLASLWVGFVTPVPAGMARPLVGSLVHEVVCAEHDLDELVGPPPGGALGYDAAVEAAVAGDDAEPRPEPGRSTRRGSPPTPRGPDDPRINPSRRSGRSSGRRWSSPCPATTPSPTGRSGGAAGSPADAAGRAPGCSAWALRIEPGDSLFYVATLALAGVWALGALALGAAPPRPGQHPRGSH